MDTKSVGGGNGDVVEQAKAVAAMGLIHRGYDAPWTRVMPRRSDRTEGVASLQNHNLLKDLQAGQCMLPFKDGDGICVPFEAASSTLCTHMTLC